MAINDDSYNKGYSIGSGLIVDEEDGGPFYTGGTASPIGLDLPVSTMYTQVLSTGVILWKHNSVTPSDWSPITSEIYSSAPAPYILSHNGNQSNNQLIGYTNLANNPVIVGFRSRLNRITTVNSRSSADFAIDFFPDENDGGNNNGFFRHVVVNNSPAFSVITGGPIFELGDKIGIYYRDTGRNANDLNLCLFFEAVPL